MIIAIRKGSHASIYSRECRQSSKSYGNAFSIPACDGIYAEANIHLVNLDSATDNILVPAATSSFSTTAPIEIVHAQPLCPNQEKCLINGTEITLLSHLVCADSLGPVTYAARQKGDEDKLQLAVSTVNLVNKDSANIQCFAENTETTKIILRNKFIAAASIDLVVVK